MEEGYEFGYLREFAWKDFKDFVLVEWGLHQHLLLQIPVLAYIVEDALQILFLICSQTIGLYEFGENIQGLFPVNPTKGADKGTHT